ncbi:MAG: hypothetical protein KF691_15540 [Phycisphaeraceae bacterium]|nr:hypothetical protein [Phycisphaeraceae bacterium]
MISFSRIGLVSTLAFSALAIAEPAPNTSEIRTTLTALQTGKSFAPKDAVGSYLALHFLPAVSGQAQPHADIVKEFASQTSTLAGLTEIFITPDPAPWTTNLGDSAAIVYLDTGSGLATELKLSPLNSPATIVFDPAGHELFRWSGAAPHDHLSFVAFQQRFTKATTPESIKEYNLPKGNNLAIEGYDPVAYFVGGKPLKGSANITSTWRGVQYRFASKENRDTFNANPDKFAPTYGGWCASAMGAKGTKVEIDPTNFKVKDGRLHLFYKDFFSDALKDWNKHEKEWEPAADANWKKSSGEGPRTASK